MATEACNARISRADGKLKLEYGDGASAITALWERRASGTLETVFDSRGAVIRQALFKADFGSAQGMLERMLVAASIDSTCVETVAFSEVAVTLPCPSCGAASLERSVGGALRGVPVVPMYACASCGSTSYYLTKEYLSGLVAANSAMFSENERAEMARDGEAFLTDLNEHIIRIFASKKIQRIR